MVEITEKQQQATKEELPRIYTPENIIYWEPTSQELRRYGRYGVALLNKARNFLKENCISQIDFTSWICNPRKGYNKTSHRISSIEGDFKCDCQGFRKKFKEYNEGDSNIIPICSHIIAVKQYCFIESKNENKKEG